MASLARVLVTLFLVGTIVSPAFSAKEKQKWLEVKPSNTTPVEIKGKKSTTKYFKLDKTDPVSIKVVGPGSLKVFTRTELSAGAKEGIYGLAVVRDGKKHYLISRTAKLSPVKLVNSGVRLGEPKSVTFKVPKGTHEFKLNLPQDAKAAAYARFEFAEKTVQVATEDIKYVPFLPRKFGEEVRILVKEEEYIYYRADKKSNVELEVIGPAKLKIVSRLEFDQSMQGEKPYRLQISNETEIVQTIPLKGKISAAASYRKPSTLVLGRGDTSYLKVPAGKHRYTIVTPDKNGSVLLRFYLPEKALGNEWKPSDSNGKAELKSSSKALSKG